MKKSNTVFLTTIFPASEEYLDEFFISLQNQSNKNFDVLVVNDGIRNFSTYITKYSNLNIIEFISELSPAKNREVGINKVLELGYDYLIFGDSDDYFSENRIAKTLIALKESEIIINNLTILGKKERIDSFFSIYPKTTQNISNNFYDSNIFGLSNIAISSSVLKEPASFNEGLIAVDWFFISSLLIQERYSIKFIEDTQTYYRQYDNNTIGMSLLLNEEKLNLGIRVKITHYTALIKYCQTNNLHKYSFIFENSLGNINNLQKKLEDSIFKKQYIEIVNFNIEDIFTGWWSEIISLEKYYEYKNK